MKERKTINIILIIFLTLIAGSIMILMFAIIKERKNFVSFIKEEKKSIIFEKTYNPINIKKLKINNKVSDIEIRNSKENQIKVIIYGKEQEKITSDLENNVLNITKNNEGRICFGFCIYEEDKVIVYLPKEIKLLLEIQNRSGDMIIEQFPNLELNIHNTSGNIEVEKINKININSISGDIILNEASAIKIKNRSGEITIDQILTLANIETASGDIEVTNLNVLENSSMKATSGNITILNINDIAILPHTRSGDIQIKRNNQKAKPTLNIYTTSGDITIK